MTTLRYDGRSPADSLAFFRDHRDELGPITRAAATTPQSRRDLFYALVLRDDRGDEMLLSGPMHRDDDTARSLLVKITVEAGFAEDASGSILTHAGVRMRRTVDGTTSLECAIGPRWQSPRRLTAAPAADALRAFARRHHLRHDDLCQVLGIDRELVESALTARWLSWERADEIAIALRMHPHDLWPEWFGHAVRPDPSAADAVSLRTRGVPA